jgi:hypothetical protein
MANALQAERDQVEHKTFGIDVLLGFVTHIFACHFRGV